MQGEITYKYAYIFQWYFYYHYCKGSIKCNNNKINDKIRLTQKTSQFHN
jgi:hypothetical protein